MAKIVKIKNSLHELINKAKHGDRLAQHEIYQAYSKSLLSVCRLYISDLHFAEDVLVKGFLKIFTNLKNYQEQQHFYAWMRTIMVNECIDFLRSSTHKILFADWKESYDDLYEAQSEISGSAEEIQQLLDELPEGCRMVFNLYVFEDYSHKEIAKELKITEGTSKSQLAYAKKILKQKLNTPNYERKLEK